MSHNKKKLDNAKGLYPAICDITDKEGDKIKVGVAIDQRDPFF